MRHIDKLWNPALGALAALLLLQAQAQTLDAVVVSASRTQLRSFDEPASVQTVGPVQIQGAGPQVNLSESLARVPGLTILDRENYAQDLQVSIRGFGARSAFGIRGIRLLIDGIPATTPDGQGQGSSISLTSMDHIEVLRGPLAQMYGNSSGGVIQAFTKSAPQQAEVGYQYYVGSYGLHRADYQLGDTVGRYGIVADYSTFTTDGYRVNSGAQRNQFNGTLSFAPTDQTQVKVVFNQFDMPLAMDPLGLTSKQLATDPTQAGTGAVQYATRKTVLQNQMGATGSYAIDSEQSITARTYYGTRTNLQYQSATVPASGVFPAQAAWTGLNRNYYGVGLQYNAHSLWGATPVDWVGGYEFDHSLENRQAGATNAGQKFGPLNRSEDNMVENSDYFVQARARLTGSVAVTSGLRYSTVRFASTDYYLGDNYDGSGSVSYRATSPVLGLTYFATSHLNLYANYGQGFETPTLAEMAYQVGPSVAKPVAAIFNMNINAASSEHFELGAKWLPDSNTRMDLALYQINTHNEIVVSASSNGQTAYKNAPNTSRSGIELSATTDLTQHVQLTASASLISAQYAQTFLSGSTTVASGNSIPGIPTSSVFSELAWNSAALQGGQVPAGANTRVAAELVQSGRIYANDTNTASADGHTLLNLAVSHRRPLSWGTLTWYGRVNNVSNERYVGSVIVNQSSLQFYEPGLPTNWTVGLNLSAPL